MLKTLDILIGATTVVLVFSMAVTVITQALTTMIGRRGRHLRAGLADLLQQLGIPERDVAVKISQAVLTHPLFTEGKSWWGGGKPRLGTVISREDFTKILLDAAAAFGPATNPAGAAPAAPAQGDAATAPVALAPSTLWKDLDDAAGKKLVAMLQANGISDPASTLQNVRALALDLEISNPALASDVRQSLALMQEAKSDYVARVNSWFDQTIDRVGQRFTKYTHYVTLGVAALVVLAVQLDMIAIVNRLSVDDHFRDKIVNSAIDNFQTQSPAKDAKQADATKDSSATKTTPDAASSGTAAGATATTAAAANAGTSNDQTAAGGTGGSSATKPGDATSTATPAAAGTTSAPEASSALGTGQPPATVTPAPTANAGTTNQKQSIAPSTARTSDSGKTASAGSAGTATPAGSDVPKVNLNDYYNDLSGAGLIASPLGYNWVEQWSARKIPGMLIAILLVSLGAPFWYNILKDLLGLRSTLAQKDDAQRSIRQTTQDSQSSVTAITAEVAAVAPAWLKGERGDVDAIG